MTEPRISLAQQAEAVDFALARQVSLANGATVKGKRGGSAERYDVQRLQAARRTIEWLMSHEAEIRSYLRLPEAGRATATMLASEVDADTLAAFLEHRSGDPNR